MQMCETMGAKLKEMRAQKRDLEKIGAVLMDIKRILAALAENEGIIWWKHSMEGKENARTS